MPKTTIEVETAIEGCGKDCPRLEVEMDRYFKGGAVFWKIPKCRNKDICACAIEKAKADEMTGGEDDA